MASKFCLVAPVRAVPAVCHGEKTCMTNVPFVLRGCGVPTLRAVDCAGQRCTLPARLQPCLQLTAHAHGTIAVCPFLWSSSVCWGVLAWGKAPSTKEMFCA